jgi:hypothetical protein
MPDQPAAGYGPVGVPQPQRGIDQLTALLQALQQRQIPALPGVSQPAAAPAPAGALPPQTDALGLLRVLITNPQLQQALQSVRAGAVTPPPVQLPVPVPDTPTQLQPVQVPIAAVLNALVALSGRAMTELNEHVSEDEPEVPDYLVGPDGDFVVDPASADDRAALVSHLFLLSDAAQRSGWYPQLNGTPEEADVERDETEKWARDAGFL